MSTMNVIMKNKKATVGLVSEVCGLKDVGNFSIDDIKHWLSQIETILGDTGDISIQFKISEDPKTPAYMITACHDGMDPKVAVCGKYRLDGKGWGEQ